MGNGNQKIDIDINKFFSIPIAKRTNPETIRIKINLSPPSIDNKGNKINSIYLFVNEILNISKNPEEKKYYKTYTWNPKTIMKNVDIIFVENNEQSSKIEKPEGLGVIIIEEINIYIKLIYKNNTKYGISPILCNFWNHSENSKDILRNDLYLGYNVLLINKKIHNLINTYKDDNEKDCLIIKKKETNYNTKYSEI